MPMINTIVDDTATRTSTTPLGALILIGIFQSPEGDHVLLRTRTGDVIRIAPDTPIDGYELTAMGAGWALIKQGATFHRLMVG